MSVPTKTELKVEFLKQFDNYIKRDGSAELREWLMSTDFFDAPASARFHGDYEGGLVHHSLSVFYELIRLLKAYPDLAANISTESAAIVALLHDLAKIDFYKVSSRNVKNEQTGKWEKVPYYAHEEKFVYGGHGGKSVFLIMKHMQLTDDEATAINCHMGAYEFGVGGTSASESYKVCPLSWLLHVADEAATYIKKV